MKLIALTLLLFTTALHSTEYCRLQLIIEGNSDSSSKEFKVSKNSTRFSQRKAMNQSNETQMILLSPGLPGKLKVDESVLEVKCTPNQSGANVSLSLYGGDSSISTTVQISHGEKLSIGEIAKNLSDKNQEVGVPSGVKIEGSRGKSSKNYFLLIE